MCEIQFAICYHENMNEKQFLNSVVKCVGKSADTEQIAEDLMAINCRDMHGYSKNGQVLARYISDFQFDWDNEAYDTNKKKLLDAVDRIKQIFTDTKAGNLYQSVFSAELAYSRLVDGDYQYKIVNHKLRAETKEQAENEANEIKRNTNKVHPEDPSFTLEDVRIREQIIDQKGNSIFDRFDAEL